MKRNLTRAEREAVQRIAPRLNTRNWLKHKYDPQNQMIVLKHKETGTKKTVPVG